MSSIFHKGESIESQLGMEPTLDDPIIPPDATPLPEDDIEQVATSREEAYAAARGSLDFLAALAMPTVFAFLFPPIFKALWDWLLSLVDIPRTFPKIALGLPRGFGKSTFVKLFILFVILFTQRKFVLVFGATAAKAEAIVSDVVDMLNEPNIQSVFGDWRIGLEKDTQAVKKFSFRGRNIIIAALGAGGSVRGLNLKNARPDLMIFDDIQEKEDASSEKLATDLETWMYGTAMKAKSPFGCMYMFIANMYPSEWSLLRRLKKNSQWTKFITGGIQEDGTSLWEELHPLDQLIDEYASDFEAGHPEIFHSEVLNDENASVNNIINLSKVPLFTLSDTDIHEGHFLVIDPGGRGRKSDATSIGYFRTFNMVPYMWELEEEIMSPLDTIQRAVTMALRHNCPFIVIESNAYQESLNFWFEWVCLQQGISGIQTYAMYSGRAAKNSRILGMLKAYQNGELGCGDGPRSALHSQIIAWDPMRTDNTDGILDIMTYAPRVVAECGPQIRAMTVIGEAELIKAEVWDASENCSF